jgi:hypothetical protein
MFDPVIDPVQRIRLSPHEHDQNCEDNYDIHIDLYNGVVTLYVEPRHVPD